MAAIARFQTRPDSLTCSFPRTPSSCARTVSLSPKIFRSACLACCSRGRLDRMPASDWSMPAIIFFSSPSARRASKSAAAGMRIRSLPESRLSVRSRKLVTDWRRLASVVLSDIPENTSSFTSFAMRWVSITSSPAAATSRFEAPACSLLAATAWAASSICGLTRITSRRIAPSDWSSALW